MAKCPKCGVEIEYLINLQTGTQAYEMSIVDGEASYEEEDFVTDFGGANIWICPECSTELFTDEESAVDFLQENIELSPNVILSQGREIENWICDLDLEGEVETNAGRQNLIEYKGNYYLIITDLEGVEIAKGGFEKVDVGEERKEGSFIAKLIKESA